MLKMYNNLPYSIESYEPDPLPEETKQIDTYQYMKPVLIQRYPIRNNSPNVGKIILTRYPSASAAMPGQNIKNNNIIILNKNIMNGKVIFNNNHIRNNNFAYNNLHNVNSRNMTNTYNNNVINMMNRSIDENINKKNLPYPSLSQGAINYRNQLNTRSNNFQIPVVQNQAYKAKSSKVFPTYNIPQIINPNIMVQPRINNIVVPGRMRNPSPVFINKNSFNISVNNIVTRVRSPSPPIVFHSTKNLAPVYYLRRKNIS